MSREIAVLLCPGRGSYGRGELGFLHKTLRDGEVVDALQVADRERAADDQPAITALDAESAFRPSLHLRGDNAAELIYFSTMAHLDALRERYDIVAVGGNSLGWYTALAAAGALSVEQGWRLVHVMAGLQEGVAGGQVLTTTIDDRWRIDPDAVAEVEQVLTETRERGDDSFAARSIRLGGHQVLAGTESAVRHLLEALPRRTLGEREFPFRLAGHGPFHTALCAEVAERALTELPRLAWSTPRTCLIDGRGDVFSPWSTDPAELLDYTATTQVTETFDFTATVRTALREFNPDVLLCAGPGESLRAPAGHVVIAEGYRGVSDREALFAANIARVS